MLITGIISGGVIFTGPSSFGSAGHVLVSDGNGNLSVESSGATFTGAINFGGTDDLDVRIRKSANHTLALEHGDGGGYSDLKCQDLVLEANGLCGWDAVAYIDQSGGVIRHKVWAGTDADISAKAAAFSGLVTLGAGLSPASLANSAAPNNSMYYSTDASKLVYKDSVGSVNVLY